NGQTGDKWQSLASSCALYPGDEIRVRRLPRKREVRCRPEWQHVQMGRRQADEHLQPGARLWPRNFNLAMNWALSTLGNGGRSDDFQELYHVIGHFQEGACSGTWPDPVR